MAKVLGNGITGKVPQPTDQELIHFAEVCYVSASGLFLACVSCHSGAEVFFLLNFFGGEGRCEVFELRNLADLYACSTATPYSNPPNPLPHFLPLRPSFPYFFGRDSGGTNPLAR